MEIPAGPDLRYECGKGCKSLSSRDCQLLTSHRRVHELAVPFGLVHSATAFGEDSATCNRDAGIFYEVCWLGLQYAPAKIQIQSEISYAVPRGT